MNGGASDIVLDTGKTRETPRSREPLPCLACTGDSMDLNKSIHPTNNCDFWRSLTYTQKREKVKCVYHPNKGLNGDHMTNECKVGKAWCSICKESNNNGQRKGRSQGSSR